MNYSHINKSSFAQLFIEEKPMLQAQMLINASTIEKAQETLHGCW